MVTMYLSARLFRASLCDTGRKIVLYPFFVPTDGEKGLIYVSGGRGWLYLKVISKFENNGLSLCNNYK